MEVARDIPALQSALGGVLVPTMGALHAGHTALVDHAASLGRPIVLSIFINPTQFGPGEDLDRYPRTLDRDLEVAREHDVDVVFAPGVEVMYPPGEPVAVPRLPAVATEPGLEDADRPGHLAGVAQVVARLFDVTRPVQAVFGEKDYQQLLLIEAMVAGAGERWPGLTVSPHPTIREPDGLAMSSRNVHLHEDDRDRALGLCRALGAAAEQDTPSESEAVMRRVLARHELETDYAVVRDAQSLLPVESYEHPARALIAARLGDVRLIDNAAVGPAA